jgi:superfamily II DNA/RNA helicase
MASTFTWVEYHVCGECIPLIMFIILKSTHHFVFLFNLTPHQAPTGSGKTMAFLVPSLVVCEEAASRWKKAHKERAAQLESNPKQSLSRTELRFLGYSKDYNSPVRPAVLVLVPTRELAMQVSKQASLVLRTKGLRCLLVIGGADPGKEKKSLEAPTPTHMIVATPGRLIDLLRDRKVDLFSVCLVVIDEADRMLSLGLAEQVSMISKQIRPDVQVIYHVPFYFFF